MLPKTVTKGFTKTTLNGFIKYKARDEEMIIEFHHGALSDSYEKQANNQGFTFGDDAEWVQKVAFGLICAHIHGCITDSEYDKILRRFQTKVLLKRLKRLPESEEG